MTTYLCISISDQSGYTGSELKCRIIQQFFSFSGLISNIENLMYICKNPDTIAPFNFLFRNGADFEEIYFKPYCRIGPYVVGFFTGYILYKTECKIKIPKVNLMTATRIKPGISTEP